MLNVLSRQLIPVANYGKIQPSIIRINPKDDNLFAICGNTGTIIFHNIKEDTEVWAYHPDDLPIEDAQWHPNENYFIAGYRDGTVKLFEGFKEEPSTTFERQGIGIKTLNWVYDTSGDFITCSVKVGALRIWNASQKTPKNVIKVGAMGIKDFLGFRSDPNLYVMTFKDGSLGLFDVKKKKMVWNIEAGHSETIFEIRFKPSSSSVLATGSYDGYIKIWDINSMKVMQTFSSQTKQPTGAKEDTGRIVYCISWAPGLDDYRLVSAHANGDIYLWDYIKGKQLGKIRPGGDGPIYRLDWNQLNSEYIACGSNENIWYFFTFYNEKLYFKSYRLV